MPYSLKGIRPPVEKEAQYAAFKKALKAQDFTLCKAMIDQGYDINHAPPGDAPPLIFAIYNENFAGVRFLCAHGGDVTKIFTIEPKVNPHALSLKVSGIFFAKNFFRMNDKKKAMAGYLCLQKSLLCAKEKAQKFPLHAAVARRDLKSVIELSKTHDINQKNSAGDTPLGVAAFHGQKNIFFYLKKAGGRLYIPNNYKKTPLHHLCERKEIDLLMALLRPEKNKQICLTGKDQEGNTPFHCLVSLQNWSLIRWAIHHHIVNFSLENREMQTPLHLLAGMEKDGAAPFLAMLLSDMEKKINQGVGKYITHRKEINHVLVGGYEEDLHPLDMAAQMGNVATYEIVFRWVQNPLSWRDCDGNTLMHRAFVHSKGWDPIAFFKKRGLYKKFFFLANKAEEYPLHSAIRALNQPIVMDAFTGMEKKKMQKIAQKKSLFEALVKSNEADQNFALALWLLAKIASSFPKKGMPLLSQKKKKQHLVLVFEYDALDSKIQSTCTAINREEYKTYNGGENSLYGLWWQRIAFIPEWPKTFVVFDAKRCLKYPDFYQKFLKEWDAIQTFSLKDFEEKKAAIGRAIIDEFQQKVEKFCRNRGLCRNLRNLVFRFYFAHPPHLIKKKMGDIPKKLRD